jgi:NADH-quinone oxidoreductase subunit A
MKADDKEKLSTYECGFNPFADSKVEFDIRFYLVAILFIIFDLELSFLFPFAAIFDSIEIIGIISMLIFLFVLTVGFVYE